MSTKGYLLLHAEPRSPVSIVGREEAPDAALKAYNALRVTHSEVLIKHQESGTYISPAELEAEVLRQTLESA